MKKFQLKIFGLSVALIGIFLFSTGCSHKITGEFYFDLNKNGFKDFGEPNVPNVKIMITKDGTPWREGNADDNGTFSLTYMPRGKEEPVFALFVDQDYVKNSILENPDVVAQINSSKNYSFKVTDFETDEMSKEEDKKASTSKASDSSTDDETDNTTDNSGESDDQEATGTTDTQAVNQAVETPKGAVKAWKQKNAHLVIALNFDFSSSLNNVSTQEYKMFYKCPTPEDSEKLCDYYDLKFYYPTECTPNDIIIPDIFDVKMLPGINLNSSTNVISFTKSMTASPAKTSSAKASSTSSSSTTAPSGPLTASATIAMQKISAQDLSFKVKPEKLGDTERTYEIKTSATCFGKNLDLEPIKITVAKEKPADEEKNKNYIVGLRIEETITTMDNEPDNTVTVNAQCLPCLTKSGTANGVSYTNGCTSDPDWSKIGNNYKYQYRHFTINITNLAETDNFDVEKGLLKVTVDGAPAETMFIGSWDAPVAPGSTAKTICNRDAMGMECVVEKLYSGALLSPSFKIKTPTKWLLQSPATIAVKATFEIYNMTNGSSDEDKKIIESTPYTISIGSRPNSCDKSCMNGATAYCEIY